MLIKIGALVVALAIAVTSALGVKELHRANCLADVRAAIEVTSLQLQAAEGPDRPAAESIAKTLIASLAKARARC